MFGFILKRIGIAIPTLLVIIASAFFLMKAAPGGPFDRERQLPEEIKLRIEKAYNLDKPVHEQFALYLGNLVRGDLGPSFTYKNKTVQDIIVEGAPVSAVIGLGAMTVAIVVGGLIGVIAALRQNKAPDYGAMSIAMIGICVPPLVMGPLLVLLFANTLGWLPSGGLAREYITIQHMTLPILTLALPQIAIVSRLTRASTIEALRSNHVRTARSKGIGERAVVWRHVLPAALIPVVSYLAPALAGVMVGSFVVETVFQLPGIGRQFVTAALQRDYTLVMGVVVLYGALILLFTLIADLLLAWLDPRIRQSFA